ncbi:MAG TPA: EamA family transporter [Streptosporangiaceae bacterium]|nr:EamA family transporter [Streptosporangiaceae bacterium]
MSLTAITLILIAALAHASWNLLSKQASDAGAACFVWLMSAAGLVLLLPAAAATAADSPPRLPPLAWVFLAGTGVLHAGYFLLLQNGYRLGDLSAVYPVSRGSGALLAAAGGIVLLGERPGAAGLAGIALIVAGIVAAGLPARDRTPVPVAPAGPAAGQPPAAAGAARRPRAAGAVAFALLTGVFIASYTLWDKYAVSALSVPPVMEECASVTGISLILAPFALRDRPRRARLAALWHGYRVQVLGAAVLSPVAYVLVLTAMRFTAVSAVAPAREVSVLFGVLLGGRLLREGSLPRRLAAAAAIAAGILALAAG